MRKRQSRRLGLLIVGVVLSLVAAACGDDDAATTTTAAATTTTAAATTTTAAATTTTAAAATTTTAAATTTTAAPTTTTTAPLSESTVQWAGFGGMAELLFFIAEDGGFFEDQGLTVERIELGGGVDLFTALASGSVDFTQLGTQHVIRSVTRGLDFRGIMGFSHGPNEFGVISAAAAAAAGITNESTLDEKFEALRGLKIGTGRPGSTTTTLAIGAMEARGINTETDVELVPLGSGPALLPAFQSGEVDAFFWIPPETQIAAQEDGSVLIDFRELDELATVNWAGYVTTDSYIIEHRDTVLAFLRAILLAREWALANEADAYAIARARFSELDEDTVRASFQIDYDSLKPSVLWSESGFEQGRYILNLGLEEPNTTLMSAVVTNDLVYEAASQLGMDVE